MAVSDRYSGTPGWPGYFLSAYGIAVKHGYTGTEEEWLESLRASLDLKLEDGRLYWKNRDSDEDWQELTEISTLLTAAENAAELANTAAAAASGATGDARAAAEAANTAAQSANTAKAQLQSVAAQAQASGETALAAARRAEAAGDMVENAVEAAETAEAQATAAAQAAETAKGQAQTAAQAANSAAGTANAAADNATSAAQAANSAAGRVETAITNATQATAAAKEAAQAAGDAATDARTAESLANSAATAASTAAESAETQAQAAQTASGAANSAASAANSAAGTATTAAGNADAAAQAANAAAQEVQDAVADIAAAKADAEDAVAAATQAATDAGTAVTNANQAVETANSASADATAAAETARSAAQSAQSVADDASAAADRAEAAAQDAADSAEEAVSGAAAAGAQAATEQVSAHNSSASAHQDIRTAIGTAVSEHDSSEEAHADIRQAVAEAEGALGDVGGILLDALETLVSPDVISGGCVDYADGTAEDGYAQLATTIVPSQDFGGQTRVWAPGCMNNLTEYSAAPSPGDGVTYTRAALIASTQTCSFTARGTATSTPYLTFATANVKNRGGGYVRLAGCPNGYKWACQLEYTSGSVVSFGATTGNANQTLVLPSDAKTIYWRIKATATGSKNVSIYPGIYWERENNFSTLSYPANLRAISPHTSAVLHRTAKNMLDCDAFTVSSYQTSSTLVAKVDPIPPGVYTISYEQEDDVTGSPTQNRIYLNWYHKKMGGNYARYEKGAYGTLNPSKGRHSCTFTIEQESKLYIYHEGTNFGNTVHFSHVQLEVGEEATDYEPYQGSVAEIDLDGSVYAGSLNVKTGLLTLTHQKIVAASYFPIRTLTTNEKGYPVWQNINMTTAGEIVRQFVATTEENRANYWSNAFMASTDGEIGSFSVTGGSGTSPVVEFVLPPYITTQSEAETYLQTYEVEALVPLAEPTTKQLTAAQLSALGGHNTIWSDCGEVTVKYTRDGTIAINQAREKLAQLLES